MNEKFAQALHAFYQFVCPCELKGALLFFCVFVQCFEKMRRFTQASQSSKAISWFLVCVLA